MRRVRCVGPWSLLHARHVRRVLPKSSLPPQRRSEMILDGPRSPLASAELLGCPYTSSPNNERLSSDFWLPAMLCGPREGRFLSIAAAHLLKSPCAKGAGRVKPCRCRFRRRDGGFSCKATLPASLP